jgi:hypothetical protein
MGLAQCPTSAPALDLTKCDGSKFNPAVDKIPPCLTFATPAETIAGTATDLIVNPAGLAAAIPAPVIVIGSVAGVGISFAPAGTYINLAVAQTLTGAITTLTNTTNRPQLVTFTLNNEAIWYAPFAGDLNLSYQLVINGVPTSFSGYSRLPPYNHSDGDNRNMTGVINYSLPANTSATFALKETMSEANGTTVVVPANTLLSYGGFVTYVQHSV